MKPSSDLAKRVVAQWAREKRVARRADFVWRSARACAVSCAVLLAGSGMWSVFTTDEEPFESVATEELSLADSQAAVGRARTRVLGMMRGRQSVSGERVRKVNADLTRLNNRLDRSGAGMP